MAIIDKTFDKMMMMYKRFCTSVDFNGDSLMKQQSTGRHVNPLGHIIMILSQLVFVLTY
jgi:hypothetical protein